ncbi:MAG: hypothetical protein KDD92_18885 [Caldilineaceae bacterium]|nr:hypothetical protein [Caldilineaceae bacterium]
MMEFRLILVLSAMFFLPGAALLTLTGAWRRWKGLQRGIMAVGLSIAFYPVFFYSVRFWLPGAAIHGGVLAALLLAAAFAVAWGMQQYGVALFAVHGLEWIALGVFALTALSRFWFALDYPFPAWSDSLHHVMLTEITAQQGRLPVSLEPYYPVDISMYHMGLYALSAAAMQLARVPAPDALLWTAQFLNAACGLGVYLVLDRYAGRPGAIVGAAVAGLFSVQPALYANWGRFTQLAGQAILLIAAAALAEAAQGWAVTARTRRGRLVDVFFAAMLSAAVFLLHFRVALFYLPLLLILFIWLLWRARATGKAGAVFIGFVLMGIAALFLVLPTFWEAYQSFAGKVAAAGDIITEAESATTEQNYYVFPWASVPYLVAPRWLLWITGLAAVWGLLRRNRVIVIALLWIGALLLIGNAYLTGILMVSLTNMGAILIMLYLPIALIIGAGVQELLAVLPAAFQSRAGVAASVVVLLLGVWGVPARAQTVEAYRHFVTPADLTAIAWIKENIPADAKFGINTYFWLPRAPHGVDAGYWLPYLTGNPTNAATMLLYGEADAALTEQFMAESAAVEKLEAGPEAVGEVYDLGIRYLYIGAAGDFSGPGLDAELLRQSPRVAVIYAQDGVTVLALLPEEE